MSETKALDFNDFKEFNDIASQVGTGLIAVLPSKDQKSHRIARLVAHSLSNNSRGLVAIYPVMDGETELGEIRDRALREYPEHGLSRAGAIVLDATYGHSLNYDPKSQLAILANELGITIVLIAETLTSVVEQDANLIAMVTAGPDSTHTLTVIKNRNGQTGIIEFVYGDPADG